MLPYCDPRDNEMVRAQLVGQRRVGDRGYRATARCCARPAAHATADSVESARTRYIAEFEASLAADEESRRAAIVAGRWDATGAT
jgi:hypothetical protein